MPEPAGRVGIGQQVVGQQRVKIEDRVAIEADLLRRIDQELDRVLVVEDHLRFQMSLALGLLAQIEQAPGVEQGIGVALEAA